jgi:hypothetical protein
VRIRKNVWKLPDWDPIIDWYARAIADMQTRPISDPTSWRYQAAIHDYSRGADPLARPSDRLPSASDQKTFWAQCQHGSWYFLPWHRMYLAYFEQVVAATVKRLGGPADWALPYWNYSDSTNPNARKLPPAFREPASRRIEVRDVEELRDPPQARFPPDAAQRREVSASVMPAWNGGRMPTERNRVRAISMARPASAEISAGGCSQQPVVGSGTVTGVPGLTVTLDVRCPP